MTFPDIGSLVPHDGAMVLLDRLIAADAHSVCAQVGIHAGTLFFDGQGVGAWVGIEYMAQAIAAHAGYAAHLRGEPVKVGLLLGARRYVCSQSAFALGSVLHVHAQHALQGENGLAAFECRIEDVATAAIVATATVTVFLPENLDEFLQRSTE